MELTDQSWNESLHLLKCLIRHHPAYASDGLEKAQIEVANYMRKHHWHSVEVDHFSNDDIKDLDGYIDVSAFGHLYHNYGDIPKRNIIGIVDSGHPGPTLIMNGHLDVDIVSSANEWSIPDGWRSGDILNNQLYGRGSTDMLSGLVAQLTVANLFNDHCHQWRGRIIVTAVTDEEIGGNGTLRSLHWLRSRQYLDNESACLIAEPSNKNVCLSSLGFLHFIITFRRSPIHMGVAIKDNNAIWDALRFIENFDGLILEVAQTIDPCVDKKSFKTNIGIIKGGMDSAIPIPRLDLEGTIFFPAIVSANTLGFMLKEKICKFYKDVEIQISEFGFEGADFVPGPLYENLKANSSSVHSLFPSPCDARLYKNFGIPTVIYGPGNLEQAHAVDEYICLSDLKNYIQEITKGIKGYLKA